MHVSLVLPAFNEERLLPSTLAAVRSAAETVFHGPDWSFEIVVCDNNSTDATAEIARAAGARVVFEPVNQIGRARNTGAAAATGEFLIFIDADSRPTTGLLADVAAHIREGRWLGGGSTVRLDRFDCGGAFFTGLWNLVSRVNRWAAGSFIWVEARAFRELGGFNNELFASEEIELFRRLKRLSRERGLRLKILHRHPLETSARKMGLYSKWEHLRFLARTVFGFGRNLRHRDQCTLWYDGRR